MRADTKKHLVPCTHCGKDVLDHMTQCPFCQGELQPKGYAFRELPENIKKIRNITNIIFFILAAVMVIALLIRRGM